MAFSLLRKVNEKVLNSVSLLDASLDVDYIIADIRDSITSKRPEKVEQGIASLLEFGDKNRNALILQREWVQLVFWVINWMGSDVNRSIFENILQLIIKMIDVDKNDSKLVSCCDLPDIFPINEAPNEPEYTKIIEEIANVSKGGTLLLEPLRKISCEEADIYIKFDILKVLIILQKNGLGSFKLDQIILSQGDYMGLLFELIMDGLDNHSSYMHNSLELLMLLTKSNSELQKMITYNGSISKIFNIIRDEIQQFIKNDGSQKGFINSKCVLDEFLLITDFKIPMCSSLEILQISIEIIFHVTKSQNCLKFIIEASNEALGFMNTLTDVLGFCFLYLEYSMYNSEMYNLSVSQSVDDVMGDEQNAIFSSVILRIVEISSSYVLLMNMESALNITGKMREVLNSIIASPVLIRFGLLKSVVHFLMAFKDQNSFDNVEWCSMVLSSGVTPALWFGFNKIVLDYKPTIDYIMENNSSEIQQHARQIQELREKYRSQMENSLLEWFGVMIMPKNFSFSLAIMRDNSVFESILNSKQLDMFSLDNLGRCQSSLFKEFISFCFWFPITEFLRLNGKSVFSSLEVQLAENDFPNTPAEECVISLTNLFHYRLFRCVQILQVLVLSGIGCSTINQLQLSDITSVVNKIWEDEQQNSEIALNSCSFQLDILEKLIEIGILMTNDIFDALKSESNSMLISLIATYGVNTDDEKSQQEKKPYVFNSITTLIQIIIFFIAYSIKNPDYEFSSSFIQNIRLIDEKLKNQLDKESVSLISDVISILLFRLGALKNTGVLNQVSKRLKHHFYDGFVLSKQMYACLLHSIMSYTGNRGIYSKENISIKEKIDHEIFSPIDRDLLKNDDECVNCIYLSERMLNERRNLIRIIKKKQEEINVLVKAYMDSQDALKRIIGSKDEAESDNRDIHKNLDNNKMIDPSDHAALLEILGILYRKFPVVKGFIDNNIMLSSDIRSDVSSRIFDYGIQSFELDLVTDSCEDVLLDEGDQRQYENSNITMLG
ncbi:VDP-like vesicular transport factor [Cryptosporidium canis]|nr:VDP-like vesicular transport factor [Cryptosporidium canis]